MSYMHAIHTLVNLTPHSLDIESDTGEIVHIPPSGQVARVETKREMSWSVRADGHSFSAAVVAKGNVVDLPEKVEHTGLIVSAMVLDAMTDERDDLLAVGELIRDESGKVIGARGFTVSRKLDQQIPF